MTIVDHWYCHGHISLVPSERPFQVTVNLLYKFDEDAAQCRPETPKSDIPDT